MRSLTPLSIAYQVGEPSYELFVAERDGILESLKRRARIMVDALSKLEGVTCNDTEGALYVFPRVTLPDAAVQAAKEVCILYSFHDGAGHSVIQPTHQASRSRPW